MVPSLSPSQRRPKTLRAVYTALAPVYDRLVPFVSDTARSVGRSWLDVKDGERVLEVGTGPGRSFRQLVASNPTGWTSGIDLTPAMLAQARQRLAAVPHTRYGLRQGRATALPYPNRTFDAVFASYVIDVLPHAHVRPSLRELRRVLQPEGRLVLVYMAPPQTPPERVWARFARALPLLTGGGRPLALRPLLPEEGLPIQNHTTCTQAGLRSAITRATRS